MLGLGVDVVSVARWRRLLRSYGDRVVGRVFAPEEQAQCRGPHAPQQLAARWAGKEAVAKALGCRPGSWRDVVIQRSAEGVPGVVLRGAWEEAARVRGVTACHVSLSHEKTVAVAVVLAVTREGGAGSGVVRGRPAGDAGGAVVGGAVPGDGGCGEAGPGVARCRRGGGEG